MVIGLAVFPATRHFRRDGRGTAPLPKQPFSIAFLTALNAPAPASVDDLSTVLWPALQPFGRVQIISKAVRVANLALHPLRLQIRNVHGHGYVMADLAPSASAVAEHKP